MLNALNTLTSRTAAVLLTLLFSATMVVGAVGPAVGGDTSAVLATLDNTQDKPSLSLA